MKQPIVALYFEFDTVLKVYNLGARPLDKGALISVISLDFFFWIPG